MLRLRRTDPPGFRPDRGQGRDRRGEPDPHHALHLGRRAPQLRRTTGYDCSGSVSYALHGGEFLESPLPSGPMESWGVSGEGRWITVWANAGHAYAEIAGFRWDTAGDASGTGPRWHEELLETSASPLATRSATRSTPEPYAAPANRPERICPCFPDPTG